MSESVKIRVAGNKLQVEILTEQLREWSKQWGKKKIFRVKRYDRNQGASNGTPCKYHRTFGARRFVNYIDMKLPEDPQKIRCKHCGSPLHENHKRCWKCGKEVQK